MSLLLPWLLPVLAALGGVCGLRRPPLLMPPPRATEVPLPPDQWYTQRLDHFQPTDQRTWQQRYYTNDSFYKPGGPVFLMIGGEGPASPVWMVTGQWIEYAKQYNALCFQLEHRFYGKSYPTEDMSVENLRYLSSEQALADLAAFSAAMTSEYSLDADARWVAFGGSYPGSLAAWYRLKYPHMVHAAVSTSAPLLAKTNFLEYLQVVTDSIEAKSGDQCYDAIQEAFTELEVLLADEVGWAALSQQFKLCSPFNGSVVLDVSNLVSNLADLFEGTVQYNEDNRGFEGAKDANITINVLCDVMTSEEGNAIDRLAQVNQLLMTAHDQQCLDHTYDSMMKQMQDVDFSSPNNSGMRQWIYQTCTEFGWYQTSDYGRQPFGHHMPLSFSVQQCMDAYGAGFNRSFIDASVAATNVNYGARALRTKRVVLVNGSIDPWHAMGLTESADDQRPAIYINGTAHCANMYPARPEDLPDLVSARQRVGDLIGQWLQE
ncbi:LOW QUALITY PROTEIN: putative serine protease K12H4.7 [Pollicipes pollicipes]|uniref:LOW QUALITY PROTEIN: putative serine protease K12H4.7 n=1 Tax=Pollicipes pollicipes TaxID=41117 RepID=UPI001884BC3B|nr:LOW QUALITY PROTEIN: putative serine protease K12H4.7 [Pollicipes pollicipes]